VRIAATGDAVLGALFVFDPFLWDPAFGAPDFGADFAGALAFAGALVFAPALVAGFFAAGFFTAFWATVLPSGPAATRAAMAPKKTGMRRAVLRGKPLFYYALVKKTGNPSLLA
jgi:hypothetical protein